ncbi:hypothetical protein BX666DRAFT_588330 [Dichotomocladium elegans]|nr:hypothetical protein BX666DRAFT_588330 [Dichotomocladium elegans]
MQVVSAAFHVNARLMILFSPKQQRGSIARRAMRSAEQKSKSAEKSVSVENNNTTFRLPPRVSHPCLQVSEEPLPISPTLNAPTTNNSHAAIPRPAIKRPYMSNRHASRLMDPQAVTDFIQNEESSRTEFPTPIRSRSSSVTDKRPAALSPVPSRSESSSRQNLLHPLSPTSNNSTTSNRKRLSRIPGQHSESSSTLDLALPSLNLSFFENDSAEILNLSKDLGASIELDLRKEQSEAVNEMITLLEVPESPIVEDESDGMNNDTSQLQQELDNTKRKLAEAEANFQKIKQASKRALEEFSRAKEEFAKETAIRQQHEVTIQQLREQVALILQAQEPSSFAARARADIERIAHMRASLERSCQELKHLRSLLMKDIEGHEVNSVIASSLAAELQSLRNERAALEADARQLTKARDEVINEMIMLNTKNAELTNMNNDLSRRMTEREREAAAVMAGTSFVRRDSSGDHGTTRVVQRDSFNGTQAPKVFKFKKSKVFSKFKKDTQVHSSNNNNNNMALKREHTKAPSTSGHSFQPTSFMRLVRCDVCNDKVWGRSDLRCQGCGFVSHAKCLSQAPQLCFEASTLDLHEDLLSPSSSLFGNDLSDQSNKEERLVPRIVEQCIQAVELRGMDYEVTSVLKHYFRELPNPLMTYELYSKFIELASMEAGQPKLELSLSLLAQLPKANYNTLRALILHLSRVCVRSNENLMTCKNLAVVFAPTLMRDKDPSRDLLDISSKNATIDYLISQAKDLFP